MLPTGDALVLLNAQTAAQASCWKTEQPNHKNKWMLSVYVSENHGYASQLYISLDSILQFKVETLIGAWFVND